MKTTVLRLGHRKRRDERLTSHVGLVARAFGADEIIISGERDATPLKTVRTVTRKWGGPFRVSFEADWKKVVRRVKKAGNVVSVHLTVYGEPISDKIDELRRIARKKSLLVIVGSQKVPGQVFLISDYNISITTQPHSEAAALAVFLHELFRGKEITKKFKKAKIKVIPQLRGKRAIFK